MSMDTEHWTLAGYWQSPRCLLALVAYLMPRVQTTIRPSTKALGNLERLSTHNLSLMPAQNPRLFKCATMVAKVSPVFLPRLMFIRFQLIRALTIKAQAVEAPKATPLTLPIPNPSPYLNVKNSIEI